MKEINIIRFFLGFSFYAQVLFGLRIDWGDTESGNFLSDFNNEENENGGDEDKIIDTTNDNNLSKGNDIDSVFTQIASIDNIPTATNTNTITVPPPTPPPSTTKTIGSLLSKINLKEAFEDEENTEKADCQDVASILNNRWNVARNSQFNSQEESLNNWLQEHGILIFMCQQKPYGYPDIEIPCFINADDDDNNSDFDHFSASWIGGGGSDKKDMMDLIATNVISSFPVNNPINTKIGIALDPTMIDIKCSYPINANSKDRDNNGCGPIKNDYVFGSQSNKYLTTRQKYKKQMEYNKTVIQQSGWSMDKWWNPIMSSSESLWKNISCDKLYHHYHSKTKYFDDDKNITSLHPLNDSSIRTCEDTIVSDSSGILNKTSKISSTIQRMYWDYEGLFESGVSGFDHLPCVIEDESNSNKNINHYYQWSGACSWSNNKFQNMIDSQLNVIKNHIGTKGKGNNMEQQENYWSNEVVLDEAVQNPEAAMAVLLLLPNENKVNNDNNNNEQQFDNGNLNKNNRTKMGFFYNQGNEMQEPNEFAYYIYAADQLVEKYYNNAIPVVLVNQTKEAALNGSIFTCPNY